MNGAKQKLKRKLLAWFGIFIFLCILAFFFWQGILWFNMPSKRTYPVRGVDVSHYQGQIDWNVFAEQGISFAFIKATEGSALSDDMFLTNWLNARDAGITVGAYHFFSFDSPADTQAQNIIRMVPVEADALPPVIDLEFYRRSQLPDVTTVQESLKIMLDRLSLYYGKTPIIYTTNECYETYLADTDMEYTLWIRNVFSKPQDAVSDLWRFWQYNSRGLLDGYSGDETYIDLNLYRGSFSEFQKEFQLTVEDSLNEPS